MTGTHGSVWEVLLQKQANLVQTLQESTYYKAMTVCLGCVYIRQISLMFIYLSTFSLGLYFLSLMQANCSCSTNTEHSSMK